MAASIGTIVLRQAGSFRETAVLVQLDYGQLQKAVDGYTLSTVPETTILKNGVVSDELEIISAALSISQTILQVRISDISAVAGSFYIIVLTSTWNDSEVRNDTLGVRIQNIG